MAWMRLSDWYTKRFCKVFEVSSHCDQGRGENWMFDVMRNCLVFSVSAMSLNYVVVCFLVHSCLTSTTCYTDLFLVIITLPLMPYHGCQQWCWENEMCQFMACAQTT